MTNHPYWIMSGPPQREDSVLPFLLERNARETPDRIQFQFEDGETWTCQQTLDHTRSAAALLREQGVGRGDFVLAWLPSGQDMLRSWFGLNYIGAVFVPLNVDYRGRRSGENVSSIEVEAEVASYEAVAEAAVVGIPSDRGDEEILVAVVLKPGHEFDPRALAEYLVPRYFRALPELPRTPTNKVKKVEIRNEGVTADTWDREASDMRLKRTRFD